MFIGRKNEILILNDLLTRPKAQFVAITGRRRIGKSTLVEEVGRKAQLFIRLQGLAPAPGINKISQLENLAEQLIPYLGGLKIEIQSWSQFFQVLKSLAKKKRTLILLDEISWMGEGSPEFLGQLKIAWDQYFKDLPQFLMALCGSVSSWIDHNILNGTNFVGRISQHIHLQEFSLEEISTYLASTNFSSTEKIKLVNITGGVPKYLELINPRISAAANIKNLAFRKGGFFVEEFDKIFNDTFHKRAPLYKKILLALVSAKLNLSELCKKLKIEKSGNISAYLEDLEMSGFIARNYKYSIKGGKSKLSTYRICDNYVRFYLKYILPTKEKINALGKVELESLPHWHQMMGFQFENLILNNTPFILDQLAISEAEFIFASPYFQHKTLKNKGACQIDLLIGTKFQNIYIGEIKFRQRIDGEVIDELREKMRLLEKPKNTVMRPFLICHDEAQISERILDEDFFCHIVKIKL